MANPVTATRPRPVPTLDGQPFWQALREHRLIIPFCPCCQVLWYPPVPRCARCLTDALEWRSSCGLGVLHSWAVVQRPFTPGIPAPYIVAEVELDDQPGLIIESTLVGASEQALRIDMPVEVTFLDDPGGFTVHAFQPVHGGVSAKTTEEAIAVG